ncbi:PREDICTED: late histone H2B.L1-like [Odobenus rosmarus divergens]|uniref:Late histone H2B.L1-like n=1 Tax=Odobenus rosmarus divergens TaxID=9708 RepID=A0A2U3X1N9_ODORO|nr:PREDICTED: late histone H2B.L1-like [Odobenus rosmarus divergens]
MFERISGGRHKKIRSRLILMSSSREAIRSDKTWLSDSLLVFAFCPIRKDLPVTSGNAATINGLAPLKLPPVPFLLSCREGEPNMAEPGCETSSEESLGTEETTAADWKSPNQKQPRRRGRRGGRHCRRFVHLRRRHRSPDSFATYFPRVLKHVHEGLSLSQEAESVMDSFVKDIFECIAEESSRLARFTKRSTITTREIQTAVRLVLPGEIGKHTMSEATKAIIRFTFHQ